MAHLIDTPRTEVGDRTRFTAGDASFSELPSFYPPAGGDDLLGAMRSKKNTVFATPGARAPLANRSRNAKNEFTPLLHSAAKNRFLLGDKEAKENHAGLVTPAALKPGYKFSSPAIPEASSLMDTSMTSDHTPMGPVESSSAVSTPMALPRRGEMGMGGDGGNVLTLKEQETKLALIDKENFGLKLKIHFLEENLKRSGSEWNQVAIQENTELKTTTVLMERDLKKYRKQVQESEIELEKYRQQLRDYVEKMKRRHMDESMKEEMERLQALADERGKQIEEMQAQLESVDHQQSNDQEQEKLREEIEELETELKEKDLVLDEQDEEIKTLKAKLQSSGDADEELEEKDRELQHQTDRIEELEAELRKLRSQKDEESENLQQELDAATREHEAELEETRKQAEIAERDKREQLREFESRLQSYTREKNAELETTHRKLQALEQEKVDEIESLELRLKLAESKGDNQSQLAQQAAQDAHEQLKRVTQEKDAEVENLRSQINAFEGVQDELDTCQKQLQDFAADVTKRHAEEARQEEAMGILRDSLAVKERELKTVKGSAQDREYATKELDRLRGTIEERDRELSAQQQTVDAQATSLENLRQFRSSLANLEREHASATNTIQQLQAQNSDRERQLDTLRKTLQDRTNELEVLRQANEEPGTEIEGLQSIVRHRDQHLEELRETVDEQDAKLEDLQKIADERLRSIEEMRSELASTKQDLEDELQVLEASLDEAEDEKQSLQSKIKTLEKEIKGSYELQSKLEPIEKELRAAQRERTRLQKQIESLERDREVADDERVSLQTTIDRLRKDLKTAQLAATDSEEVATLRQHLATKDKALFDAERKLRTLSNGSRLDAEDLRLQTSERQAALEAELEAVAITHRQAIQEKSKSYTVELEKLHGLLNTSNIEISTLQARLTAAEQSVSQIPALRKQLNEKERQIYDAQVDTTRQMHSKAQEAREECGRLRAEIMDKEKYHARELRGLSKQIQCLQSRIKREEGFRAGLGWQKKWFLVNVEMYNACNQADLRLIEEMGITPNQEIRERRPTLRTVASMIIFVNRTKKLSKQWAESKKMQRSLVRELEGVRARRNVR